MSNRGRGKEKKRKRGKEEKKSQRLELIVIDLAQNSRNDTHRQSRSIAR